MEGVYLLSALDLGDGVLCRGFMVASYLVSAMEADQ